MKARALAAAAISVVAQVFAAAGGAMLLASCASCQSTVRSVAVPAIAGASFDGAEIDQSAHRVYLANKTDKSITVVDVSGATPKLASTITVADAPSGLALAPDRQELYAGLGSSGIAVVDTRTMQVADTLTVEGGDVDLVDYSAQTGMLYAGAGSVVLVVDVATGRVTKRLTANGNVEQPRYDPADGMVYVTVPGSDTLLQIDPQSGLVTHSYVIKKCHPAGLAINPARQLAMLGCGSSIGLVNLRSGADQTTRAVQGADVVTYDPRADRFVVASPHERRDSAIGVFAGDGRFMGSVTSTPDAHAAVYDDAHGMVYAPGPAGLMSFAPPQCEPPPAWLNFVGGLSVFAVPLLAFAVFLVWYARRMRRGPRGPSGPTDRELREQDLEQERERMRALEDGIFGPES